MKCPHCKEDDERQFEIVGTRDSLPAYRDYKRGVIRKTLHVLCNTCARMFYSHRDEEGGQA